MDSKQLIADLSAVRASILIAGVACGRSPQCGCPCLLGVITQQLASNSRRQAVVDILSSQIKINAGWERSQARLMRFSDQRLISQSHIISLIDRAIRASGSHPMKLIATAQSLLMPLTC